MQERRGVVVQEGEGRGGRHCTKCVRVCLATQQ